MIKAADHFSFTVSHMETALHFFCDMLGMKASPIFDVSDPNVKKIVGYPDAVLRVALVRIPGGPNLELVQYVQPAGKSIDSRSCNPGAAHIAFHVDNIQEIFQDLTSKGISFINPPVWAPGNDGAGTWGVAYLKGPDGITVELIEKKMA